MLREELCMFVQTLSKAITTFLGLCCSQVQRLAALERLVKKLTQQAAGGPAHNSQGTPGGIKDRPDERLLRRLGMLYLTANIGVQTWHLTP